ncbi:YidB family protein [Xanthobacter sp. TB0139]|uniref:YidB family protein n=1 Tax=Xanthobacter sp. TB0139 TaxID=3459178 RepID=UPI004039EB76
MHPTQAPAKGKTMGLFDQMMGGALGGLLGKAGGSDMMSGLLNTALSGGLGDALPGMVNNALAKTEFGNLEGLLGALQNNGLGDQVASWLSSGANLDVSAQQIIEAIGADRLASIGSAVGIPTETLGDLLSQHLPQLIDKLSPNGTLELPQG